MMTSHVMIFSEVALEITIKENCSAPFAPDLVDGLLVVQALEGDEVAGEEGASAAVAHPAVNQDRLQEHDQSLGDLIMGT